MIICSTLAHRTKVDQPFTLNKTEPLTASILDTPANNDGQGYYVLVLAGIL
jgi:hypothetical protein